MKLPDWIEILPNQPGDAYNVMRVRVRRWHPVFWYYAARMFWRAWREAGKA